MSLSSVCSSQCINEVAFDPGGPYMRRVMPILGKWDYDIFGGGKWDLAILSWRFGDVMLWRKSCDWGLKFFKLGFGDLLI